MQSIVDLQAEQNPPLDTLFTACIEAENIQDMVDQIFPHLEQWLGVDIFAITMVEDRSVMVASKGNIDPILQQRICVHSAACIGVTVKSQSTPNCGLDLMWVGQTPTCDSRRIDSDADILWTGAIQTNGWLRAVITLYGEQIRPISIREQASLKALSSKVRDAIVRFRHLRTTREPSVKMAPAEGQILCFRLEHMAFVARCYGTDRAALLQREAATCLGQKISHVERIEALGPDRVLLVRKPGVQVLSSAALNKVCEHLGKVESRDGIPLMMVEEETSGIETIENDRSFPIIDSHLMPSIKTREQSYSVG